MSASSRPRTDLAASIARQVFREPVYYRLNVFQIHIAPLRERTEISCLSPRRFLEDLGRTMGVPPQDSQDAREWLLTYPGRKVRGCGTPSSADSSCDGGLITRDPPSHQRGSFGAAHSAEANGSAKAAHRFLRWHESEAWSAYG